MSVLADYKKRISKAHLKPDAMQEAAVHKLDALLRSLRSYRPGRRGFFRKPKVPKGLYIWGDVGRGKSMLMDLFFSAVHTEQKQRIHFNAFMVDVHARIHAERQKIHAEDPILTVGRAIAANATLLCFDEFQVTDIADAMVLGRLFEQLFARGVVVVTTSNTPPDKLYEGGLNRQLFQPFIGLIKERLQIVELNGPTDYRLERLSGLKVYITPLGKAADAAMNAAWLHMTGTEKGLPRVLPVLGRSIRVREAAAGVARFTFEELCARPLAAPDYLAIAREFHTVLIDHIPRLSAEQRNEARRFVVLIDTLYDENVKLVCSAAAPADQLYQSGDGAEAFRRTVSRLVEMQSAEYQKRGHGANALRPQPTAPV